MQRVFEAQCAQLIDQAGLEHGLEAVLDLPMQDLAVLGNQCDLDQPEGQCLP